MFGKIISILNWPLQFLECEFWCEKKNLKSCSCQVMQLLSWTMWNFKSWSWMLWKSSSRAQDSTEVMAKVLLA